jgi:dolichol-phosphate mannosyltransferase
MAQDSLISIIIPIYNEAANIPAFFKLLKRTVLAIPGYQWEVILVNDGSRDNSAAALRQIAQENDGAAGVKAIVLEFSRNFGKEAALSAGLAEASGDAALMIDADFQHPVELIPEFLKKWSAGGEVVVGVRKKNKKAGLVKRAGSFVFYRIINRISGVNMQPGETDFRLLDHQVIAEFNKLSERNRLTRALVDWLGFERDYIFFEANERANGHASYSFRKLISLALNSFVSLSLLPLKLAGYLGILIIITDGPFGLYVLLGKYFFHWPFASSFSGPAQLAFLITFLVGVILTSLGLVALYIAHIHDEVLGRPLYIIKQKTN